MTAQTLLPICLMRRCSPRSLCWQAWPVTRDQNELEKRKRFWELERLRESVVDNERLSEMERKIHYLHKESVKNGHFSYEDPGGKGTIETRYKHYLTGLCCGNACRHCIFNFYNVPKYLKATKTFNSSFWVDAEESISKEPTLDLRQFSLRRLKKDDDIAAAEEPFKDHHPSSRKV